MHRMLIERMENRILLGIIAFVGTMVLVGWVAINENARMASFTRQYNARSIERGAELFAQACSTCHGPDGRGLNNRAPGLNNPALFGHNFLADIDDQLDTLSQDLENLTLQKTELQDELAAEDVTERRREAIETAIAELDVQLADPSRLDRIAALQTERQGLIDSMTAAIDNGYDPDQPSRLVQVEWGGTLNAYIVTTLIHGRPTSVSYWPDPMVSWSNRSGGPLRDDQIQDIANYIQNFDKGSDWSLEDLLAVNQFARVPGEGGGEPTADAVGSDVAAATELLTSITGNPSRGQQLYESRERSERADRLGCSGCHYNASQGPDYEGTWLRVVDERLRDSALAGYTPDQYLIESILEPGSYEVEGYPTGVMPANFGQRMSAQDLADVIEYIKSTDPAYVAPQVQEPLEEQPEQSDAPPTGEDTEDEPGTSTDEGTESEEPGTTTDPIEEVTPEPTTAP